MESLKEACRKRKDNFYKSLPKDTRILTAHEKCNLEYKFSDRIRNYFQWSGMMEQSNAQGGHTLQYLLI